MNAQQWRKIKPILESALELSPDARKDFLDSVCTESSLRREIDSLLLAHDQSDPEVLNFGTGLTTIVDEALQFRLPTGKKIGAYKILEKIAQGGMGAVYRAVRADGQYTQQVALKIVRAELGAESVAARFRNERQILANLDHPNIAKILDGGTTDEGLPYLVMEFIAGLPITDYCAKQRLTIDQRLQLFRKVCAAVHYAHQRLVIHRDIKPTNVLVTAEGVPKLLDFGIAKVVDQNLPEEIPSPTAGGLWLMTPEYASPEQLRGEQITTATDVYSLGLVLLELLTGQPAHHFSGRTPFEVAQLILEAELLRPSVIVERNQSRKKATQTSEQSAVLRATCPDKLQHRLSGDLDNIVTRALRREPQERYSSVEQFAEDIKRHEEHLPVIARRDTALYRASKFFQRHKAGVTTAFIVTVALIAALAFALTEAQIARSQRMRAETRFNEVRYLADSMMFDVHDAIQNLPGSTPARKLLVERALGHLDNLAREAGSDASLQRDLAAAYEKLGTVQGNPFGGNLGDTEGALESYGKSLALRKSIQPRGVDDTLALARVQRLIGSVHANRSDGAAAIEELKAALSTVEHVAAVAPSYPAVLEELQGGYYLVGLLLASSGDYESSAAYFKKELLVVENRLRAAPESRSLRHDLGAAEARTGDALARMGARSEGQIHARKSVEILQRLAEDGKDTEDARWLGMARWMLGDALLTAGDTLGALASYKEQLRLARTLATADPANAVVQYDLGCSSARVGEAMFLAGARAEGVRLLNQSIDMFEAQLRRDPAYIEPQFCLAAALVWRSEALESTTVLAEAIEGDRKALSMWEALARNSPGTAIQADAALIRGRIALTLARKGDAELSSQEYHAAIKVAESIASSNPRLLEAHYVLADLYTGLGDLSRTSARRTAHTSEQRIAALRDSLLDYHRSLDQWHQIDNPGRSTPAGFACGNPRSVMRALSECKRELVAANRRSRIGDR